MNVRPLASGRPATATLVAHDVRLEEEGTSVRLSCAVAAPGAGLPPRLWFSFPAETAPMVEASGSPFLPVLLLVAMRLGRDLRIEAPVSSLLLRSAARVMEILVEWGRDYQPLVPVEATAAGAVEPPRGAAAAAFYSCGLDSAYTLVKNVRRYPRTDSRALSHLVMVQGFDVRLDDRVLFDQLRARARRAADAYGLALLAPRTNLREGGFRCVDWQHAMHGAALASVALALGRGFHTVYLPSTDHLLHECEPWGSHPGVDPLWSTETVELVHDGVEARRLDKFLAIVDEPVLVGSLRTCKADRRGVYNCGECYKCVRAMLKLELAGRLAQAETFPRRLELAQVAAAEIPSARSRRQWTDVREWARSLGRTEVVRAIDAALVRNHRARYRRLAPLAPLLSVLGVSADDLRRLRRAWRDRLARVRGSTLPASRA